MFKKSSKKENIGNIQADFITLTSHQLRTPLSGMKWLLELMSKSTTGNLNQKQRGLLSKIYTSNERMIALVNDLLEVSRIESGEAKLYLQPTDLVAVIRSLIREKTVEVRKKRLKIDFTVEHEPLALVKTELNKIRQALGNLISNAIAYTRDGGLIGIDLKQTDGQIQGQIADTGVGIPRDQQKYVFNKFFRGSNILKFETNGTGLGLYITKAFIEASGGKIWFKSEEGKGTTFYFALPVA